MDRAKHDQLIKRITAEFEKFSMLGGPLTSYADRAAIMRSMARIANEAAEMYEQAASQDEQPKAVELPWYTVVISSADNFNDARYTVAVEMARHEQKDIALVIRKGLQIPAGFFEGVHIVKREEFEHDREVTDCISRVVGTSKWAADKSGRLFLRM